MALTRKDRQGLWAFLVVGVLLVAMFVTKAVLEGEPQPGPDNCVGTPKRNTVVVLDQSEEVSTQTLNEIVDRARSFIMDSTAQNERVSVFTVSDVSKKQLVPVLDLCRPASTGNGAYQNVKAIKRTFAENFEKPVLKAIAVHPADSPESPIAQAITDLSRTKYLNADRNVLLVFSDMLENTTEFSLYHCGEPDGVIDQFRRSRRGAVERPKFRNTRIELHLIPRLGESAESLRCRDRLWTWFFGDDSGPDAALESNYLPGGVSPGPTGTAQGVSKKKA